MAGAIVRLLTCGSVDDGKSTLIGRLLVETDSIPHDTIGAARKVRRSGSTIPAGEIDFSLLTDGLEAEREQGITIDVAYRSMTLLDGKRLIISDAPGHEHHLPHRRVRILQVALPGDGHEQIRDAEKENRRDERR